MGKPGNGQRVGFLLLKQKWKTVSTMGVTNHGGPMATSRKSATIQKENELAPTCGTSKQGSSVMSTVTSRASNKAFKSLAMLAGTSSTPRLNTALGR